MSLLDRVADAAGAAGVPVALIGAGALAVHGVSRSTFDIDLLSTDPRALDSSTWAALGDVLSEIRRGDADDPLAGAVRFQAAGERIVDLVVARPGWPDDVLARAVMVQVDERQIPVVRVPDLILLKLYAGGTQDRWDIEQLLAAGDRTALARDVEAHLGRLPARCRELWAVLAR